MAAQPKMRTLKNIGDYAHHDWLNKVQKLHQYITSSTPVSETKIGFSRIALGVVMHVLLFYVD